MVNLSYQFNDVVVSLAGGQRPLMVLLQQGSQIAQVFGPGAGITGILIGVGQAIATLITPTTLLIAGIAAVGGAALYAFGSFVSSEKRLEVALGGVGRAAGATVEGGEYFDWYYAGDADRDAQIRTPITDGVYGKPWVHRAKDVRNWWLNQHFNRLGGVQSGSATSWVPQSKPVWLTEFGVSSVDKGTNQPNVFYDPKSSESALPYYSRGNRDDLIQRRGIEALLKYWSAGSPPSRRWTSAARSPQSQRGSTSSRPPSVAVGRQTPPSELPDFEKYRCRRRASACPTSRRGRRRRRSPTTRR